MPKKTAVLLLSGGLDSALNLALSAANKEALLAITMRYGQRAMEAECRAAKALAHHYNIEWTSIELPWLGALNETGLTRPDQKLPTLGINQLDDAKLTAESMRAVWVANRNGVFLNIAAAFAESRGADLVLAGFNREEAATFPDNSVAYLDALTSSFSYSTLNKVKADSYTKDWDKKEILQKALEINLPFSLLWSCYESGPERCWKCESCKRTERGLLQCGEKGRKVLAEMGRTF